MAARKDKLPRWKKQILVIGVLVAVFIILNFIAGGALITLRNLRTIFVHSIFHALTAWGLCFIFTTGLCDLSIGAIVLLSANVGGLLGENLGLGYPGMLYSTGDPIMDIRTGLCSCFRGYFVHLGQCNCCRRAAATTH